MKTKAILKNKFARGFILNQENVIKLKDIVAQRVNTKLEDYILIAKIYREDSLVYTTFDIDDIFKEENSKRNRIIGIELSVDHSEFEMHLVFEKDDGCYLEIESNDKDLAYLTFSDTKDYLNSEVLKQSPINTSIVYDKFFSLIAMLLSMISGLVIASITKKKPQQDVIQRLIEATDINEKINYILNYQINTRPTDILMSLFLGMGSSLITIFLLYIIIRKLFPHNIFYFGKEMFRYDKIQDLKSKIYWIIVAGLLISIIGGLIVNSLSK